MTNRTGQAYGIQCLSVALAVAGSAAGAAVPVLTSASAANATWAGALGGVSGVTNSLQLSMRNYGLSYDDEVRTWQTFVADWRTATSEFRTALAQKEYESALAALLKAGEACQLYEIALNQALAVTTPILAPVQSTPTPTGTEIPTTGTPPT
jgi:hypothetical protein